MESQLSVVMDAPLAPVTVSAERNPAAVYLRRLEQILGQGRKPRKEEEGKEAAVNDYAYFTMGACGPCRFGQYRESYSMALDGIGLRDFRMFFLSQTELNQGEQEGGGQEDLPPSPIHRWKRETSLSLHAVGRDSGAQS